MTLSQLLIAGHTTISVIAILVGALALRDLFRAQVSSTSVAVFIVLAIATSASGFILPLKGISPPVVISIVALVILAAVLWSRGRLGDARWARWIYVGGLEASEYLLIFVGVVQAFMKIPVLESVAPRQSEPPFAAAQAIVLVAFVMIGVLAIRAFAAGRSAAKASLAPSVRQTRHLFPLRMTNS